MSFLLLRRRNAHQDFSKCFLNNNNNNNNNNDDDDDDDRKKDKEISRP